MKFKIYFSLSFLIATLSVAQEKKEVKPKFNQELATSLGADQYGMKAYTIVMLTTGPAKIEDKAKMSEIMKGHMTNIGKLADEGKIIVAGPFLEKNKENYRGMFIFNTKSKEEAEQWVKTDPAVKAGVFSYELLPWYGSAALPLYVKHHQEITKENP
ncbi:YciI family protein [Chryseobacterium sp. B21-037]|uniref:YciI family protein n=1 Tax=unclassified Chryseobacterium TaxID=2593645 RepID=UPI002359D32E|nr:MULTISPECIES: YciI family protein [unclassified Chryseobacterium]MDC8106405.1 YciI family protein [Chryseobacterium sp. B21-037]MDQ1804908.1 YciI family protein [Chryseobacterium sp. CKR4-1]